MADHHPSTYDMAQLASELRMGTLRWSKCSQCPNSGYVMPETLTLFLVGDKVQCPACFVGDHNHRPSQNLDPPPPSASVASQDVEPNTPATAPQPLSPNISIDTSPALILTPTAAYRRIDNKQMRTRRARQEKTCDLCGTAIPPGSEYFGSGAFAACNLCVVRTGPLTENSGGRDLARA